MHYTLKNSGSVTLVLTLLFVLPVLADDGDGNNTQWPVAGRDLTNSRNQPNERKIDSANVSRLSSKWIFTSDGDISATPTVADDTVYFPDWAGNLFAVNQRDGKLLWRHKISDYNNYPNSYSRVSPAIHDNDLIIGDIESGTVAHNGANVMAVSRQTGSLRWITKVDRHIAAIITGSPVVFGNTVFVGVSSIEESLATNPQYPCCSFRGSVVALNAETGQILWQTYTAPDNQGSPDGYSGNAVWQPPAVDVHRGLLFLGTGNNYEVPASVRQCVESSSMSDQPKCFAANDYFDTALALDMKTGHINWSTRLQGFDIWTVACIKNPNPVSCPVPSSPDYDLGGSGPNLLPNLVGFGQKSGIYWALNPDTGKVLWSSVVGPGSTLGGIEWGTATDGERIYVAITNNAHKPYPLINGTTITSGAWSALSVASGKILWQTADPGGDVDMGPVSTANGVVYAPSFLGGVMRALDAVTGKVLWSFASGGSVAGGPSIVDGMVFWGSGYARISPGLPNNKLFAFTVGDGQDKQDDK